MIKSIIFDMDGTLLDSSYAMTLSVNHVRKSYGLAPIEKEYLEFIINEPCIDLPKKLYDVKEYSQEHRDRFAKHYLANANLHVKPYDGAYELLESLHVKGITLNIATNASDFFARNMLEGQDMLKFFSFVIGANNVENNKPNPDMLHHISSLSKIPLTNSLLVGDSIKDEGAARSANIDFLFASWGYGKSDNNTESFKDMRELKNYLLSII
ncbi:MAG TPA: HAD family hydrolase [Sulfurospirillum arcachonense]|nr:HAD family hydrolase [Sulfurospirillum arcachonense]HIP44344.1 HAD family hydrolase [Sulfurospirillum arcachonense]